MLTIDRLYTIQGVRCCGFFVRNGRGKVIALGADSSSTSDGFVSIGAKRYAKDVDLCRSVWKLTGLPVKWNLSNRRIKHNAY